MDQLTTIALALALAWASGIRLYMALFVLGLAGNQHWFGWTLPPALELLAHPLVLGTSALLFLLEFFADKIPGVDSIWDALHTFVRIPAGALLAAGVMSTGDSAAWMLAAALIGGSITAGTHLFKAGGRLAINTSPEPVTNWTASVAEDGLVLFGLWLAIQHPWLFIAMLAGFILLLIWLVPKIWRFVAHLPRMLRGETPRPA